MAATADCMQSLSRTARLNIMIETVNRISAKCVWKAVGNAEFEVKSETPINNVHKNYAFVSGDMGSGIRNLGYGNEGFAVRNGEKFDLNLYAVSDSTVVISVNVTNTPLIYCVVMVLIYLQ